MDATEPGRRRQWIPAATGTLARVGSTVLGSLMATPPRAYLVVSLALAVLFSVTVVVTSRFHAERHALAQRHYERGRALARQGQHDMAVYALRASLALERGNPATERALAATLLDAGRPREAGTYLASVLRQEPTSGQVNLLRARVARALSLPDEAEQYYLRAIYGEWPRESVARRTDARFELVTFLLGRGLNDRALGELTAIKADSGDDVDVARRLGALFLQAGASDLAANELRAVTAKRPDDAGAWSLLSEAELALGRYAATITAAERAVDLSADASAAARLRLAREVVGLDPTARRLRATERERRVRTLLERVVALLDRCADRTGGTPGPALAGARARAVDRLDAGPGRSPDAIEGTLDALEELWRLTVTACPDAGREDAVVAGVMTHFVAQEGG